MDDDVVAATEGDQDSRGAPSKRGVNMPGGNGGKVKSVKRDFALWKNYKEGVDIESLTWDTEIGVGRPGWHIEVRGTRSEARLERSDSKCNTPPMHIINDLSCARFARSTSLIAVFRNM